MASDTATQTGTGDDLDERTRKARTEDIRVLAGRENRDSHTLVVENGDGTGDDPRYDVMVSKAAPVAVGCSCPDETYHQPDGGCKHRRYVTELLNVVETLAGDEYVSEEQIRTMVDAGRREIDAALKVVGE